MIPPEFIEDVLSRNDIVEIIEARVTLKKSGQNHSGLCPFHNEKSPSFSVSQDKQFYYCFGCQASGSALKFLMEHDRLDFVSAVEYLAQRVGMQIPEDRKVDPGASLKRKSLYDILEQSSAYYREQLRTHDAKAQAVNYLKGRGLSGEIARDFGIGYAPPGWDNLLRELSKSNADRQLLIDSGMATENTDEQKVYDRFRDRIMFPIRDMRGRTIAFGARVLSEDAKPKYLNSPETAVFHKGRELYGLYEARKRNRKLDKLLVVEGYMDVVALAQNGVNYSVATLGTATSTDHIERMFRIVPQITFCFDGDTAGRGAAWKALKSTLPVMRDGVSAKFMFVPDGEDPDSLIRSEGQEKFEARIEQAQGLTAFFFSSLELDLDMHSLEGKAALSKLAVPLIQELPESVFKQLIINELSSRTGLANDRLLSVTGLDVQRQSSVQSARRKQQVRLNQSRLVEDAMVLILRQPDLAYSLQSEMLAQLSKEVEWQLLSEIVNGILDRETVSPVVLLSYYQDSPYFDYLRGLAEKDPMLSADQRSTELADTLTKLLSDAKMQQNQKVIDSLSEKPLSSLSPEERELLSRHTRRGNRSL